jgi:hypothetical protein
MAAPFPALFCHEPARVEKLDIGTRIHLSWTRAGRKALTQRTQRKEEKDKPENGRPIFLEKEFSSFLCALCVLCGERFVKAFPPA